MDLFYLQNLLDKVHGCTFANMDLQTEPSNGFNKTETGIRILLFGRSSVDGYERLVKRRLAEAGKDPQSWAVGERAWGEHVDDLPIIRHKDTFYLQCIVLADGKATYYIGDKPLRGDGGLGHESKSVNSAKVRVICPKLSSITRLALMDEVLVGDGKDILTPSGA